MILQKKKKLVITGSNVRRLLTLGVSIFIAWSENDKQNANNDSPIGCKPQTGFHDGEKQAIARSSP